MSATGRSRPQWRPAPAPPPDFSRQSLLTVAPSILRASDRRLLGLLGEHQVLTTGQLGRLTGMPERTVQHRLGVLYRDGLISRHRPHASVGTCPYHCWLTSFGAAAVEAEPPGLWSEDPSGLRTVAALSELWLGIHGNATAVGLTLRGWRRLKGGVADGPPGPSATRRASADAELTVRLNSGTDVQALVFARVDRVPGARLAAVLSRWADHLATTAFASAPMAALVLTRTAGRRTMVLAAAQGAAGSMDRVAVGVVEPNPAALATGMVWRAPDDEHDSRLCEVLARVAEGCK